MKKILAAGLAGLIAIGAAGVTTTAASAKDWNGPKDWKGQKWNGHHHHRHGGGNWGWGLGGFALGYGLGAMSGPYYGYDRPYYGSYYRGDSHVQWCLDRYRTYNPRTNTFFVRPGVERVCVSPYG
jgi:hypothetical protein